MLQEFKNQWLGLRTFTAEGKGSIPDRGTKTPQATWHGQKKKKKNKLSTHLFCGASPNFPGQS